MLSIPFTAVGLDFNNEPVIRHFWAESPEDATAKLSEGDPQGSGSWPDGFALAAVLWGHVEVAV